MPDQALMGSYHEIALVDSYLDGDGNSQVIDSVTITPSFGALYYSTLDLGYPSFRSSSQNNPQQDGTYNQTAFMGDRSVSLGLKVLQNGFGKTPFENGWDPTVEWNSAAWWIRYMSGWVTAARRIKMYLTDDTGRSMWMPLVGAQAASVVSRESAFNRDLLLSWTNPTGKLYSFSSGDLTTPDGRHIHSTYNAVQFLPGNGGGREYNKQYPHEYDTGFDVVSDEANSIYYEGTVPNGFLVRIYTADAIMNGPVVRVTGPDGHQATMGIEPFTIDIAAESIIEFDTNAKTIVSYPVNDPTTRSDLAPYVRAPFEWGVLKPGFTLGQKPGLNTVLAGGNGSFSATFDFIWNDAHLM